MTAPVAFELVMRIGVDADKPAERHAAAAARLYSGGIEPAIVPSLVPTRPPDDRVGGAAVGRRHVAGRLRVGDGAGIVADEAAGRRAAGGDTSPLACELVMVEPGPLLPTRPPRPS